MVINDRIIDQNNKPFVIAEMSGNHNQSLQKALDIVDAAAVAGVNAIKLQTATPDGLTLKHDSSDFLIDDTNSPWHNRYLYDLYQIAVTPWEWHEDIFKRAKQNGLLCFSSPFEPEAVDFLEKLEVPAYKIASFENNDTGLLRKVARTQKPIILSTGMANVAEIFEAIEAMRSEGNDQIILLKTTSTYPATPKFTNVLTIPHMRSLFKTEVGLSDHTMGVGAAVAAVAHGATVIEKHFTLSRKDGGVDSTFSLEPSEMKSLVIETERAWQALGEVKYGPSEAEKNSTKFRRSLYVVKDIREGEPFTKENVRSIRPGYGLAPKYLEIILGNNASRDIERGEPLSWEDIK